jgi:hypothetical protein
MKRSMSLIVSAVVAFLLTTVDVPAKKMKADALIALHLKAIGENLVWKNRVAQGLGTMDIRVGGQGRLGGPAMLLAEGDKLRTDFNFGHTQYPRELLIRNGDKVDIAYISPGIRSQLGRSIWNDFPRLAQEGLYGGVLSTDWALLDLRKRRAKVRYRGLKKFEGKKLHELEYRPKKGVDYKIRLYFEPETFRHVASHYRLVVPDGMGRGLVDIGGRGTVGAGGPGIGANSGQAPGGSRREIGTQTGPGSRSYINLSERFSDFKEVDGLTLPFHYKITLNFDAASSFVGHWEIKIDRMSHNRQIAAKAFAIK